MDQEFRKAATLSLRKFDSVTASRGAEYYNEGRIKDVTFDWAGRCTVTLKGGPFRVVLFLGSPEITYSCSCPKATKCLHAYAVLLAISAGALDLSRPTTAPKNDPVNYRAFLKEVADFLGRPLDKAEERYMETIKLMHERCQSLKAISAYELGNLGFNVPIVMWGKQLQLWSSFPKTVRDFWYYIRKEAQERRWSLPAFLKDFEPRDANLGQAEWEKQKSVMRWTSMLEKAAPRGPQKVAFKIEAVQMQLLGQGAGLSVFGPSFGPGRRVSPMFMNQVEQQCILDTSTLDDNSDLLFTLFTRHIDFTYRQELIYSDMGDARLLQQVLKNKLFRPLIRNEAGALYEFKENPLQWQLLPPAAERSDYELTLTTPDGTRVEGVFAVVRGNPNFYLTPDSIYEGPAPRLEMETLKQTNKIPAEAIETVAGYKALKELNVEPPTRLKELVKYTKLKLLLSCKIEEKQFSKYEECVIESLAVASNNRPVKKWNGHNWVEYNPGGKPANVGVEFYDEEGLGVPDMFVNLYWDYGKTAHTWRITKTFPEEFVTWVKGLPPDLQLELHGELADLLKAPVHGQFKVDLQEAQQDWFDLKVVLNVTDTTLTKEELDLLLAAKGKFVRLAAKGWRKLELQINPGDDEALANLGLSANELSPEPQRLHSLQLAKPSAASFIDKEQFSRIQARASEIKTRVTPPLPAAITAELRPYQLEGFHFLAYLSANSFGGILADDMGLGKTLQTLAWIAWLHQDPPELPTRTTTRKKNGEKPRCTLIVCPKSVMDNWKSETERFAPSLKAKMWSGNELATLPSRLGEADLHVINYSQLRSAGEELASIQWMAVILDEGQYIKNPTSLTAMLARKLKADHRLILSGTPIENRLLDLWSLMEFSLPGLLGNRASFARLYGQKDDPFARKRLAARVRPFLLRRTKSQVAKDLPDRIEEDLFCEMEGYQLKLYKAELKHAQQILLNIKTHKQLAKQRFHFLTSLLRLRQICCHPDLYKPAPKSSSAKLDSLIDQLEPLVEEGQKILIFSQFVEMLDIIQMVLDTREWKYYKLIGATENRGEMVKQFQGTEGACIFLISLKAGGSGLNLTAASYVILFDPWWNPAVENQAIDRTHRIGQVNKVIAYRLLIKNSIEEKIRLLQKQKSAIVQDVLGEENFTQNLTLDDLKYILSDNEPET